MWQCVLGWYLGYCWPHSFPSLIGTKCMSCTCAGSLQSWALTVHLPVPHSRTWRACIVHTVQEAKKLWFLYIVRHMLACLLCVTVLSTSLCQHFFAQGHASAESHWLPACSNMPAPPNMHMSCQCEAMWASILHMFLFVVQYISFGVATLCKQLLGLSVTPLWMMSTHRLYVL